MADRLCIHSGRKCNPAREHCQCWWESAGPADWGRRWAEAMAEKAVNRVIITVAMQKDE